MAIRLIAAGAVCLTVAAFCVARYLELAVAMVQPGQWVNLNGITWMIAVASGFIFAGTVLILFPVFRLIARRIFRS